MAWNYRFPHSRPREAKGGIKAQSQRGEFGQSWWAKRWIGVLEEMGPEIGSRLTRGRSYARHGQVLSLTVQKGKVKAKVQGSQPLPYNVGIEVKPLGKAKWARLVEQLSGQAYYLAKLLAGEMPEEIENAFVEAGMSLFPEDLSDLRTECTCPDPLSPCKHIAAVYYLLGEEFNRDPFLMFKLRGMTREELVEALAEKNAVPVEAESAVPPPPEPTVEAVPIAPSANPAEFWNATALPADWLGEVHVPPVHAALPKRLRGFPLWRGQTPLIDALESAYERASAHALEVMVGTEPAEAEAEEGGTG